MAPGGRIDELRKRLEKEPDSRLFAQLAEELRKAGELDEAIAICSAGLEKHPTYPSARMTLGRALKDSGDLTAAREQFETVVKGAPDNILASRLLGECLEGLGELEAAAERYRLTLVLAPGDAQLTERLEALAAAAQEPEPAPAASATEPAGEPEGAQAAPGDAATGEPPEAAGAGEPAPGEPAVAEPLAPIPLADVEEDFELERPHEAPGSGWGEAPSPAPPTSPEPPPAPAEVPGSGGASEFEAEFEMSAADAEPSTIPFARAAGPADTTPPQPAPELGEQVPEATDELSAGTPPESAPAGVSAPAEVADVDFEAPAAAPPAVVRAPAFEHDFEAAPSEQKLATMTLAELYAQQGHTEKAVETYRRVVEREPANARAAARLAELEGAAPPAAGAATTATADQGRRAAIERNIRRLEDWLGVVRRRRA